MTELPISVCIIAKNEEKYIEQCMRSVLQFGFEIVLCDTGSDFVQKGQRITGY